MADVTRSLSKKLSNVADSGSKHIYDGVFSAPTLTKRNASTLSTPIEDYRDIFSPSEASLGSSIPILDLPDVDRTDVTAFGRTSGVDYAGVFGGLGDDDPVGVPAQVLFRESNKKAKSDSHPSRSSMPTKIPASKSQEFSRDSGNNQASNSLPKTRTAVSKSQEFCVGTRDYPTSSQVSESTTKTGTTVSKGQEFCGSSSDNPVSSQASNSLPKTRAAVSKSQEFCVGTRDYPTSSQVSESTTKTGTTVSKGQEFCGSSSDNPVSSQASNSLPKTRTAVSKSQEFCVGTRDYPTSSQVSESTTKTGTTVSKGQEFCGSSSDNPVSSQAKSPKKTRIAFSKSLELCDSSRDIPTSSQSSKSSTKTRMTNSKSQEFCVSSKDNGMSSDVSTDQQFYSIKHLNTPYQNINQSSKDGTAGMTQIAHLHAVPGYTRTFEEVSPAREIGLNNAERMSMGDAGFSMDASKGKRQGKYIRAVSDLGMDKQISDHDAHKEFGVGRSHSTREANLKPQSVSPISNSPQLFGSNDYFRRSSSQRSKSSRNSQQSDSAAGSTSPLLELDVNSTAAASAAALKRAIEDAEAKIRRAKEFLKGQEGDGSKKLSLKNSFKVKATSNTHDVYEGCGPKQNCTLEVDARRQNKYVDEGKLLKQRGHLDSTVTSENINFNEAGGLKLKDDLNFSTTESQLADEKLHGISAQECANDAKFVEKENSPEVVKLAEKSSKEEGGGEWEATKHISQLISGVKNRFVSFISKQADVEKIAVKEIPSSSGFKEQDEGSTCQVQDVDAHIKRTIDPDHVKNDRLVSFTSKQAETENIVIQEEAPTSSGSVEQSEGSTCLLDNEDHFERDVQMNDDASLGVGEIAQDSNIGVKIHEPGEHEVKKTVALDQGKVEDITEYPDIEILVSQQPDLSEPEQEWAVQESVEIKGGLIQEGVQEQSDELLDDCAMWEHEKDQVDTNKCKENDMAQETADQSGVYHSAKETFCTDNNETGTEVQDQESPNIETVISLQRGLSELEKECQVQKSVEINGQVRQEDVQDQTEELLDDRAMWEHEKDQVNTDRCKENDMPQETTNQSGVYHSAKETFCKDNNETGTEVQDQEVDVSVDGSCSWKETEMPKASLKKLEDSQMVGETCTDELQEIAQDAKSKSTVGVTEVSENTFEHDEKKLEDAQMEEEIFTDELQETVQVAELFAREDNKTVEDQNVKSKSTVGDGVPEVTDDTCEHYETKLEDAQMAEETCTDELQERVQAVELFPREDNMTTEHMDVKNKSTEGATNVGEDMSERDNKKLEDLEMVEEICTDKFQERVQEVELFPMKEDKTIEHRDVKSKSTLGVTEVAEDTSDQAQHLGSLFGGKERIEEPVISLFAPKTNAEAAEQPLGFNKSKEACLRNESSQYAQHSRSCSTEEGNIEEPAPSPIDTKMNSEQPLVFSNKKEACLHDGSIKDAQHMGSSSGGKAWMEEPTCHVEPEMNFQQPICSETDTQLVREDTCNQKSYSFEVVDDVSEHDDCFPAMSHLREQEQSSVTRNEDACKFDDTNQYSQDVESTNFEVGRMEELKTKGNLQQPSFVCTVHDLIRKEMYESSIDVADETLGHEEKCPSPTDVTFDYEDEYTSPADETLDQEEECSPPADETLDHEEECSAPADETLDHEEECSAPADETLDIEEECPPPADETLDHEEECPPPADETLDHKEECSPPADENLDHEDVCPPSADVCKSEVHSCLDGDNEGYEHVDRNEDVEFSFEDDKLTESVSVTSSEPEWNTEQPSYVETVTKLIGEDMTETSVSARDGEDFVIVEEVVEDTQETRPHTNFQKTHCKADVDLNHKNAEEDTSATYVNSENQGGQTEVRTDMGEVDTASYQDTRMHDPETSYKRKRWFQNRDEGILLGAKIKIVLDLDEENTQGSKVDDGVETNVDERVNESGEATHPRQNNACSSVEDGCPSTEAIHRRRRWFENRGQEVLHKPTVFDDEPSAKESEIDDNLQTGVDKLVNEGKEGTDEREENVGSDQVESRATAEAAHRRRRWFESGEKFEPVQKPSIDNVEENTAKHDELSETSTENIKHQKQVKKREREKHRERKAVERAIREARQRAFDDAKERAAVEARQKAAAQDRQGKDSSEPKSGSDKASMDAKLREERAAVERATIEARERALQKAMSDKAASKSKEKDSKNQTSGPSCSSGSSGYSSVTFSAEKSTGAVSESPRRRRAVSERHRRTMERAAKALEEKNMRDSLVLKEQAERNRFADALDADVKRWLTGKDGNLRAMLSTLQYILGPDSGWQPIPLTDLMTSTAVRKAYKRAALCVHPDKLQQRGATIQQKYICEKVFDLLKDAWQKFNPDDW